MKKLLFTTCLLLVSVYSISAQNTWGGWAPQELPEQDCVGALPVYAPVIHFNKQLGCDDDDLSYDSAEISSGGVCFNGYQSRAVWLKLKTLTAGNLAFKIRNNKIDYLTNTDLQNHGWAVFDLQGQPCSVLRTAQGPNFASQYLLRCSMGGGEYTGLYSPTDTFPNYGSELPIPVEANDVYYIFINYSWWGPSDTTKYLDFTIDFTQSTTTFAGWGYVSGNVYYDENNSCQNNNELAMQEIPIVITNTEDTLQKFYALSQSNGSYTLALPSDSVLYNLRLPSLSPLLTQNCNSEGLSILITPNDTLLTGVDLSYSANNNIMCPIVSISSVAGIYRPPVNTMRHVRLQNVGTEVAAGQILTIKYNDNNYITAVQPVNIPYSYTFSGNDMQVQLPDMQVGAVIEFAFEEDVVNGVTILPTDTQTIILGVTPDICPDNNVVYEQLFIDKRTIVGSYDPNDKSANPSGAGANNTINRNAFIDYTIRFQNEGTDTAFTVKIVDTLSTYLDVSTLQLGASSHNYSAELSGQGVLTYTFNNILLPHKAVDEEGSMGYFTYRIKQKASNPGNYQIKNRAHIYFDFNDAIITNTYTHSIGVFTDLPISNPANKIGVQLYPNPAKENIQFSVSDLKPNENCKLIIYNSMGIKIQQYDYLIGDIAINLQNVNSGNYFYRLYTTLGRSAIGSFIKQ